MFQNTLFAVAVFCKIIWKNLKRLGPRGPEREYKGFQAPTNDDVCPGKY
jgi:hypothetical protein